MSDDSTAQPPPEQPPDPPPYPAAGASSPYAGPPNPYAGRTPPQQPGWMPQPPGTPPFPTYVVPDLPKATAALVVGIVSIAGAFMCLVPILAAPVAWVLGAQARKQIRSAPQVWSGEGRATAGMVLGIIGTALLVLALFAVVILVVVAVNDAGSVDTNTGV